MGNWRPVHRCISSEKTYPKFTDSQSNLLIISDDLFLKLFYSLFQVEGALYGPKQHYEQDGYFTTNQFENIGGLGVFNCESNYSVRGISYEFIVYENHCALPATQPPALSPEVQRTVKLCRSGNPNKNRRDGLVLLVISASWLEYSVLYLSSKDARQVPRLRRRLRTSPRWNHRCWHTISTLSFRDSPQSPLQIGVILPKCH